MKAVVNSLFITLFLFNSPLLKAHNYIDNPNFDLGNTGLITDKCVHMCEYEENHRNNVIVDNCYAYDFSDFMPFRFIKY